MAKYRAIVDMVETNEDWDTDNTIHVEVVEVTGENAEDAWEKTKENVHEKFPEYEEFYVWEITEEDIVD